jgi:hypothetical protein
MTATFACPLCHRLVTARNVDAARMWHTCHMSPDAPVEMLSGGRRYEVYCGNYECPSRLALRLWSVADADLIDGEVWLCEDCRPAVITVETGGRT